MHLAGGEISEESEGEPGSDHVPDAAGDQMGGRATINSRVLLARIGASEVPTLELNASGAVESGLPLVVGAGFFAVAANFHRAPAGALVA
jgi:hypothetical protein